MKPNCFITSAVICALSMVVVSCNQEDPSALVEIQRTLAESLAKNSHLTEQIASLTEQLEQAKKTQAEAKPMKMPTRQEIEKTLAIEGAKLQQEARESFPNAKVESFGTFDLEIPSFEFPFSCTAKVQLREASGDLRTLYWTGAADIKGEWKFEKAEGPPPVADAVKGTNQSPNGEKFDIVTNKPAITPNSQPSPDEVQQSPQQPESAKPKPKYDINLDNPVMRPTGR